jgi:hypothetical protein
MCRPPSIARKGVPHSMHLGLGTAWPRITATYSALHIKFGHLKLYGTKALAIRLIGQPPTTHRWKRYLTDTLPSPEPEPAKCTLLWHLVQRLHTGASKVSEITLSNACAGDHRIDDLFSRLITIGPNGIFLQTESSAAVMFDMVVWSYSINMSNNNFNAKTILKILSGKMSRPPSASPGKDRTGTIFDLWTWRQ